VAANDKFERLAKIRAILSEALRATDAENLARFGTEGLSRLAERAYFLAEEVDDEILERIANANRE
jgi:hypothetical protein